VLDGRKGSPLTRYVPVSNSPHGINRRRTVIHCRRGRQAVAHRDDPDVRKFDDLFDDKIKPRDTVVEPELGSDCCTAYDGGNAYDAVHRQPDPQVEHRSGQAPSWAKGRTGSSRSSMSTISPAMPLDGTNQRGRRKVVDLAEQVLEGPLSQYRPAEAGERSAYRYLGRQMVLVRRPELCRAADATIVHRSKINLVSIWIAPILSADAVKQAAADGVTLRTQGGARRQQGSRLHDSTAPAFGLSFQVKQGDEVTVYVTIDDVDDLSHGFCIVTTALTWRSAPANFLRHVQGR
jgi:nitrous-oxide reductase